MEQVQTKTTTQPYIRLPLQKIANCRDLGGYSAGRGNATKWQRFLRSSGLTDATIEDTELLMDYGLRTVVDLRTPGELEAQPNPFAEMEGIRYVNVNLMDREKVAATISEMDELDLEEEFIMGKGYIQMVEHHSRIKEVFDAILGTEEGAVLYHCSAGKDRTGVISMLLLGLAGVERKDIVTNYEVSFTNLESGLGEIPKNYPMNVMGSHPQNIKMAYDHILAEYGTFDRYFQKLGYTEEEIAQLRSRLVD